MKHQVRTPADALVYVTDCTLATVYNMATKKTRSTGEFERQINIAQTAINWMLEMGVDFSGTRMVDVIKAGDVATWAAKYMPEIV